jgi:MFS transporter, YNFM family, putative membrane transport protein
MKQKAPMKGDGTVVLQVLVFALVAAAFTTIYIPQPVLPVLQSEFGVDEFGASLTISAVIFGIALANLPFGMLADRYPVRPIILTGGAVIGACGLLSAATHTLWLLIAARFVQGLFIPSLTTCLVAFLARSLPINRLNVVMGSYVSATVAGGLGGRLLGGWIHPPLHWRYAFASASVFLVIATLAAIRWLPVHSGPTEGADVPSGFKDLLLRKHLLPIYMVAFGAFFVFSSIFNYLPFYLSGPAFGAETKLITFMYLSYVVGIITGPLAGNLSNRIGNGGTMTLGTLIFAFSIGLTFVEIIGFIALSLIGVCAGFFAIHAAAAGALNRRLTTSLGRANSLYVLFYYLGGSIGITCSGYAWKLGNWAGVAFLCLSVLVIPLSIGITEMIHAKKLSMINRNALGR